MIIMIIIQKIKTNMIIGNGNIAKVLIDRDDLVYFASGTSNSSCVDKLEFERELEMRKKGDYDIMGKLSDQHEMETVFTQKLLKLFYTFH